MVNIFDQPADYRQEVLGATQLFGDTRESYDAKSFVCVFPTKFCGVGCDFCFFSSPGKKKSSVDAHFSSEGTEKFIQFANEANVGYLQISGGGEPFHEKEFILESIRRTPTADRIMLVTSGIWAMKPAKAREYVRDLKQALNNRETPARLSIRLSIGESYADKLRNQPLVNLVNLFEQEFADDPNFTLQLKTFRDDPTMLQQLEEEFGPCTVEELGANASDDNEVIKIMPRKLQITLPSGFKLICGESRVFTPTVFPDMNDPVSIEDTMAVYDKDLQHSQGDYPAVAFDGQSRKGLDYIVEYNGNACTWQNRIPDNQMNVYTDSHDDISKRTFSDPISRSFIEHGAGYQEDIIREISPKTADLKKAVSIRDYAGNMLFQDAKIALYYTVRVMQDYREAGELNEEALEALSPDLRAALDMTPDKLAASYSQSTVSIVDQEIATDPNTQKFADFLYLMKLGHFEVTDLDVEKALKHYSDLSGTKINNLDDIVQANNKDLERRVTEDRIIVTPPGLVSETDNIAPSNDNAPKPHRVDFYFHRHGETTWNRDDRIKGQIDDDTIVFTIKGLLEIQKIGGLHKDTGVQAIVCSDSPRATGTAKYITQKIKAPVQAVQELRPLNMGDVQGMLRSEFMANRGVKAAIADHSKKFPGGESIEDLQTRLINFVQNYARENPDINKVIVIGHGAGISNLKSVISGADYEDVDNCHIVSENGQLRVVGKEEDPAPQRSNKGYAVIPIRQLG